MSFRYVSKKDKVWRREIKKRKVFEIFIFYLKKESTDYLIEEEQKKKIMEAS